MNLSTKSEHMSDRPSESTENQKRDNDETIVNQNTDIKEVIKEEDNTLPDTVTELETEDGVKVYLVGTAHFSKESQMDVMKTIQKVQPRVVMLELCSSRTAILSLDEKALLKEAGEMSFQKMSASIKQHGMVQGMLQVLMLNMSVHLTKQLGMAPGGEFRTAFHEARKIPSCTIQLGDRPIRITLRRALSSLTLYQKLKLAFSLLFFNGSISKEDVEKCKQRDMLEELLMEMTGEFPSLSRVFVHERDIYLAYSLKKAAMLALQNGIEWGACEDGEECGHCGCHGDDAKGCAEKSEIKEAESDNDDDDYEDVENDEVKAKSGCCHRNGGASLNGGNEVTVVGVVGIGHCPGITKVWNDTHDINSLLTVPPASRFGHMVMLLMRASLIGMLGYGCYRAGRLVLRVAIP